MAKEQNNKYDTTKIEQYKEQLRKFKDNPSKFDKILHALFSGISGDTTELAETPEPENTLPETAPVSIGKNYSVKTRKQTREEYKQRKRKNLLRKNIQTSVKDYFNE